MKLDAKCRNCDDDDWYIYSNGLRVCRPCKLKKNSEWYAKNPEKRNEYVQRWKKKNPTHARNAHLKRNYGITLEDEKAILDSQGGVCAICKTENPKAVDHCHTTNVVRGVLCHNCNVVLGLVGENTETLESMILYLNEGADGIRKRIGV